MTSVNKWILLSIIFIALALLYPGITQPVMTLTGTIDKADLVEIGIDTIAGNSDEGSRQMVNMLSRMFGFDQIEGELEAYQITRSIWGTVIELGRNDHLLVAFLVMLFSVVIPTLKLLMQFLYLLVDIPRFQQILQTIILAISKWSMADVFVMALIVSYLAGSASGQMGNLLHMESRLEPGFYFFLAYCLFSIASTAFFRLTTRNS